MAHAQKPDFVFPRNGRVHLNRWRRQFSRLLAAEVCASAWVMLDRPHSEVALEYWLPTPFASFPFTSPPVRHRMPPGSERALPNPLSLPWRRCSSDHKSIKTVQISHIITAWQNPFCILQTDFSSISNMLVVFVNFETRLSCNSSFWSTLTLPPFAW